MQYRSRLRNRVKDTYYKNAALSIAAIIVIVALVLFFGLQLLIKFSLLLGRIKSIGEVPGSSQTELLLPPTVDPLPEATNSARLDISGVGAQPGQTVELFLNGESPKETLVDNESRFTVSGLRLETGENRIKAKTKSGDEESEFTQEYIVIYETTPPALEVTEPIDAAVIKKTDQIRVVGKTEPDTTVLINDFLPIVDNNGGFSFTLTLAGGENTIKAIAKDKAGNQTTQELKVTFEP